MTCLQVLKQNETSGRHRNKMMTQKNRIKFLFSVCGSTHQNRERKGDTLWGLVKGF